MCLNELQRDGKLSIRPVLQGSASRSGGGRPSHIRETSPLIVGDQNQPGRDEIASLVLPVIAGVAIAVGAVLAGIGMGHFRRAKIVPECVNDFLTSRRMLQPL